ncbi:MAG TPA: hypothetical protein VKN64_01765, partial [Halanaerobiales bacterium]|nr:hypothetical protein [Halanaerobiales bacterium]
GTLAPGESETVNGSYTIVQSDLDNGSVTNTAEVEGEDPEGTIVEDFDSAEVMAEINPDISINKEADPNTYSEVGEVITYTIKVTNTGNVTLYDVEVNDPIATIYNVGTLYPGGEETINMTMTIISEHLDEEILENTAIASGMDAYGTVVNDTDTAVIEAEIVSEPSISITKEPFPTTYNSVGQEIEYTITVTNIGNVELADVTVIDDLLGINDNLGTLEPGDFVVVTESYYITANDIDRGYVYNLAKVTGNEIVIGKSGDQVSDEAEAEITAEQNPSIAIEKVANPLVYSEVGETISYEIKVTNDGNVTLTEVRVTDPTLGLDYLVGEMAPGDEDNLPTQTYNITQADIDAGAVENTATAEGKDPSDETVSDSDDAVVTAEQSPSIAIEKVASPLVYSEVGETISYEIKVTNDGNVTLTDVMVTDPTLGLNYSVGEMVPGDEDNLPTQTYNITQADIDAGSVENTATAEGKDPADEPVSDSDDAVVTAEQNPSIAIEKVANPLVYSEVGETISYEIKVTNDGNVTLTEVRVTDPTLGLDYLVGEMAPGDEDNLPTQTYNITQADIDVGSVENTANAEGKDPSDEPVSDSDDAVVTAEYVPGKSETAWAYHEDYAKTFIELGISNNWGWFNGPLSPKGEYELELWAGAGQNDLSKGTLVGTVIVSFDEETVKYIVDNGFYLREVQLYIGNEPTPTASPGLLGYNDEDVNSQEYTIYFSYFSEVNFNEDIYIAAHAVVEY